MHVNCSTCLELLTPSADLSSSPCGHVFHTACILQWFETGKNNCPQCRTRCRENQLRRLYFTEGTDLSESQADPDTLQNKVDSLTFQIRCADLEKKKAVDQVDALTAKNVGLQEEFKSLEQRYKSLKEETAGTRNQVRLLQGEKERCRLAKKQADELREKLKLYETIDVAVKGSLPQLNERLHTLNDYSENSRQLCQVIEAMKKQMTDMRTDLHKTQKMLQRKNNEVGDFKSKFQDAQVKVSNYTAANAKLVTDKEHLEDEIESLKTKLASLQEAMTSPSGDPRSSALSRLISENPAPLNMTYLSQSPTKTPSISPMLATKTCSIVGLNKRSPCKNMSNTLKRAASAADPAPAMKNSLFKRSKYESGSVSSQPTPVKNSEQFYNGLGGHSKVDEFPTPLNKATFSIKKPKPIPRSSSTAASKSKVVKPADKKMQTINKYFNFDTP